MQVPTSCGPRSMRTPSASSTSAEPERPVAERLPCLATAQPAPAAISAAVVETLKVGRPPPVPAVSTSSSRAVVTGAASARIVRARPAISSTVSPFVRSPISRPAICASEASPAMITSSTAAASSALRCWPDATLSIAGVRTGSGTRARSLVGLACNVRAEPTRRSGGGNHSAGGPSLRRLRPAIAIGAISRISPTTRAA